MCTKLGQQDAEELRAEMNRVLRSSHPQPNLTKAQSQALREFKRDRDHIVLTADKGVLINILKWVKSQTSLDSVTYKSMYPSGCVPPNSMGSTKIHKLDTPIRPIVSSCGSVTYGVAKELTKILKQLVGKSPHHINSTHDSLEQVKQFTLAPGECLSSYDVSALFTSVPDDPALGIIKDLLEKDPILKDRTVLLLRTSFYY